MLPVHWCWILASVFGLFPTSQSFSFEQNKVFLDHTRLLNPLFYCWVFPALQYAFNQPEADKKDLASWQYKMYGKLRLHCAHLHESFCVLDWKSCISSNLLCAYTICDMCHDGHTMSSNKIGMCLKGTVRLGLYFWAVPQLVKQATWLAVFLSRHWQDLVNFGRAVAYLKQRSSIPSQTLCSSQTY